MTASARSNQDHDQHRWGAWEHPITLRLAGEPEGAALDRLAQLDSRPLPPGPHLLGERDGRIEAAISLATGEVVADPFRRTAELCELLRCHAGDLRVAPGPEPAAPLARRPRLATA
jgi:hypothetical protein